MMPIRTRLVASLALVVAACGAGLAPPAAPRPARVVPPPPPPSASAPSPLASLCPLPDRAHLDRHGSISVQGRWLLEAVDSDETRIWELASDHAGLGFVLAASGEDAVRLLSRERVVVDGKDGLVLLELATRAIHPLPGRWVAEGGDYLLVGDELRLQRLRASDLAPAGAVTLESCDSVSPTEPVALRGGAAFEVGGSLVGFDRGAVLAKCLSFGTARTDGERVLACEPGTKRIEELDTTRGDVTARFALDGSCQGSGTSYQTSAAYAPDARYAFWFERGAAVRGYDTSMVVAVGDTKTGKVQRLRDTRATWSTSFDAEPYLGAGGRLCGRFYGFHSSFRQCDWKLAAGRAQRDPAPAPQPAPSLAALGFANAIEITRRPSPTHERTVVLSYEKHGDDKSDFRLGVLDAGGKLERSLALDPGPFLLDDSSVGLDYEPAPGTAVTPPEVTFADATHAVVLPGVGNLTLYDVDVVSGTVTTPCKHSQSCAQAGKYVLLDGGELLDLASGRSVKLVVTAEAWGSATHVPECPTQAR